MLLAAFLDGWPKTKTVPATTATIAYMAILLRQGFCLVVLETGVMKDKAKSWRSDSLWGQLIVRFASYLQEFRVVTKVTEGSS